jgi:hypothetical protein
MIYIYIYKIAVCVHSSHLFSLFIFIFMKNTEETNENPITPTSTLSPRISDGSREQIALIHQEVKSAFRESFAEQRETVLSEQAARVKDQNQNQIFSYKGKEPGYFTTKINNLIDHIPFGFRAKFNYQYPNNISLSLGTDLIDANVKLPLKSSEQRIEQPQQILIQMAAPEPNKLIPAGGSLNQFRLPPSFLGSVGIASLFFTVLLLVSPATREKIILDAIGLPFSYIKKGADLSLSTVKKGYNSIRRRNLNSECKTFFVEESKNKEKEEVDILILQALTSLLPNEKKKTWVRGSS